MMLGLFGAMMAMQDQSNHRTNNEDILKRDKPKKINPKGTKEYYFNSSGEFVEILSQSVFSCVASNEKNAIRKFKNRKL